MKYWLIFFYFSQVCSSPNTGHQAPPYYYARSFDSYAEAKKAENELNSGKDGHGTIVYGYIEISDMDFEKRGN